MVRKISHPILHRQEMQVVAVSAEANSGGEIEAIVDCNLSNETVILELCYSLRGQNTEECRKVVAKVMPCVATGLLTAHSE
jgi:hypothetical protein